MVSEDEGACKLPQQRRVTSQMMSHWAQHTAIADNAPGARQRHFDALHRAQAFDVISRTKVCEPGHSILQSDVMCQTGRRLTASHRRGASIDIPWPRSCPASCCSGQAIHHHPRGGRRSARLRGRLGSASTLVCLFPSCLVCPCNNHITDVHGDHIHTTRWCAADWQHYSLRHHLEEAHGQQERRTRDHSDCAVADLQRLWLHHPSQQHSHSIGGEEQRQARWRLSRVPRKGHMSSASSNLQT